MYYKFIDASIAQKCSVYAEHPSFKQPSTVHPWLFVFGSTEKAHKDACCVQMLDTRAVPHAYAEFNQMCRYALYEATALRLSVHDSYFNGAERRARNIRSRYGAKNPGVGLKCTCVVHAFPFSAISESNFCRQRLLIFKIASLSSAPDGNVKGRGHAVWTISTRSACKNTSFIHMLVASKFRHH